MIHQRFIERPIRATVDEVQRRVPGAQYVIHVEIYLSAFFKGAVTVVSDGMMTKAVISELTSMSGFKGTEYTFIVDQTKREHPERPFSVTIYSAKPVHVKEVNLADL